MTKTLNYIQVCSLYVFNNPKGCSLGAAGGGGELAEFLMMPVLDGPLSLCMLSADWTAELMSYGSSELPGQALDIEPHPVIQLGLQWGGVLMQLHSALVSEGFCSVCRAVIGALAICSFPIFPLLFPKVRPRVWLWDSLPLLEAASLALVLITVPRAAVLVSPPAPLVFVSAFGAFPFPRLVLCAAAFIAAFAAAGGVVSLLSVVGFLLLFLFLLPRGFLRGLFSFAGLLYGGAFFTRKKKKEKEGEGKKNLNWFRTSMISAGA